MRRAAPALAAALLAAVLAACGGGGAQTQAASTESAAVLAAAAGKARQSGSAKVALTAVVPVPGRAQPARLTGQGAFDFARQRGRLTFDVGTVLSGLGAGALGGSSQLTLVLERTVAYVRLPALAQLFGGKEWLRLDLAELGKQQGLDLGQLQALGESDPSSVLQYLRGASSVQAVGTETLRGAKTTHYKARIDLAKALEGLPAAERARLERALAELERQTGSRTLPVDVWVGDDGLVRKVTVTYPAKGGGAPTSVTVELYDYGAPVRVSAPPPSQVTDFSQLAALAGAGASTSGGATATTP